MARELEDIRKDNATDVESVAPEPETAVAPDTSVADSTAFSNVGPIPAVAPDVAPVTPDVAPIAAAPEVVATPPMLADPAAALATPEPVMATPEVAAPAPTASEQAYVDPPQAVAADAQRAADIHEKAQAEGATTSVAGGSYDLDRGLYDWHDYQEACIKGGTPERWNDSYKRGYTTAPQFANPGDGQTMQFHLLPGFSAANAIQSWLSGPTIADTATVEAAHQIDDLRCAIGDELFDRLFGTTDATDDAKLPAAQRLHISGGSNTIVANMQALAAESMQAVAAGTDQTLDSADLDDDDFWQFVDDREPVTAADGASDYTDDVMLTDISIQAQSELLAEYATDNTGYGTSSGTQTYADSYATPTTAQPGFLASKEADFAPTTTQEQQKLRDDA